MKLALVNGERIEATKGAKGECPCCGSGLNARCGEIKINHWAHKGSRNCDPWWENETEWHRSWKDHFPKDWQEIVQFDDDGEKHIADVKTVSNWVIEFQHSYLNPEERRSRNYFYDKLVWVIDGLRRPTDLPKFEKALQRCTVIKTAVPIIEVRSPQSCRLIKEWICDNSLVFFDFQKVGETNELPLWLLYPNPSPQVAYLSSLPRREVINILNKVNFDDVAANFIETPNLLKKLR